LSILLLIEGDLMKIHTPGVPILLF